jgi:hypothetical protein
MIGQYLPNNNETATVAFRQKFCQVNSPLYRVCARTSVLHGWCRPVQKRGQHLEQGTSCQFKAQQPHI